MDEKAMMINDNLLETIEYNSPTTQIKASYVHLSDMSNGITPCHWHNELECIVMLKGTLNYYVNNKAYFLKEGDGMIVNTNRLHLCGPTSAFDNTENLQEAGLCGEEDFYYAVLLLHPDTLRFNRKMEERYINPLLFDTHSDVIFLNHSQSWHGDAIHAIWDIFHAVIDKIPCFELIAQSKFFYLWSILYQNTIVKNGYEFADTDPMSPLKTMISYIQNNYQDKITLGDVAGAGMMCQSKCCRLFREALKQSPIEYLQNYRIQRGIYLLDHTKMSITEIALECGFHGASYFTETFRKINGITPKDYRKQAEAPL
ncbi:MAG: AraC family transcriptional regulator [Bacteroidales bacterium]|nr:AraC family transcriptional regulator [Clostridium sp.]MCM1204329.1 AraC family transcriptional regulator [Bacteroidales bacterium]